MGFHVYPVTRHYGAYLGGLVMDSSRRFLRTREAAAYVGVAARTLEDLRLRGGGPIYSTPRARIVLYDVRDLEAWIAAGRRTSTCDPRPQPDAAA